MQAKNQEGRGSDWWGKNGIRLPKHLSSHETWVVYTPSSCYIFYCMDKDQEMADRWLRFPRLETSLYRFRRPDVIFWKYRDLRIEKGAGRGNSYSGRLLKRSSEICLWVGNQIEVPCLSCSASIVHVSRPESTIAFHVSGFMIIFPFLKARFLGRQSSELILKRPEPPPAWEVFHQCPHLHPIFERKKIHGLIERHSQCCTRFLCALY